MLTQDDALFLKKKIPEWRKDPVKFVKEAVFAGDCKARRKGKY